MHRRRAVIALALTLWAVSAYAQPVPPWSTNVGLPSFVIPASVNGSNITPARVGVDPSTCAAPGIYLKTVPTNGIAFTTTAVILCVNGTAILASTSTAVTSSVPYVGPAGSAAAPSFAMPDGTSGVWNGGTSGRLFVSLSGTTKGAYTSGLYQLASDMSLGWNDATNMGGNTDVFLSRDAANTLAQRNGANAQLFNIYGTYTSATNYERFRLGMDSGSAYLGTSKGSGGGTARQLIFQTDETSRWSIGATTGHLSAVGAYNITTTGTLATGDAAFTAASAVGGLTINAQAPTYVLNDINGGQASGQVQWNDGAYEITNTTSGGGAMASITNTLASFRGSVSMPLGSSTTKKAAANAFNDVTTTTSGTVQNTVYTLNSVTLPAASFGTTGQSFIVEAWGTLGANSNAKDFFLQYGGSNINTVTGTTGNGSVYYMRAVVTRTGANTQRAIGNIQIGSTFAVSAGAASLTATDSAANALTVSCRNTAAAAECGTGLGMTITFLNQ